MDLSIRVPNTPDAVRINKPAPPPPKPAPPSDAAIRLRMELQASAPGYYANNRKRIEAAVTELERTLGPEALRGGGMVNYVLDLANGRRPAPLAVTAQSSPENFTARYQLERQYPEAYQRSPERANALIAEYERAGKPLDAASLAAALTGATDAR